MIRRLGIEGIYIVHALKGYELHEQRINRIFGEMKLEYEFVTDGSPCFFSDTLLNAYFCPEINSILSPGVLSCTLNHILCYERIVKNGNKYALIFEDDPVFFGDFIPQIENVAIEANSLPPGFIISLENTALKFPDYRETKKGKFLYEATHGRCAGAYLIDLQGAKNALDNLRTKKCRQVVDWWHNTLIADNVVRMYWAYPAFVEQGSINGQMFSTNSSRQKSLTRRLRWLSHKYYKTYIYRYIK